MRAIRTLREAAGLAQKDLATMLNVTRQTLSAWESGRTSPPADRVPQIASVLGCSIEDLYNEIINQEETESHDLQ